MSEARYKDYFCHFPFEHAAINAGGEVFQCCAAFLPTPAGNVLENTFEEVWNSEQAQEIRSTILDGSFRHCVQARCPYLLGDVTLIKRSEITNPEHLDIIANNKLRVDKGPRGVHLAYDPTCNLSCAFCRTELIALKGSELDRARTIHDRVVAGALADARLLMISAQGDPFASRFYFDVLKNFDAARNPELRIKLTTNGLLFTPEAWEQIKACHDAINWIHVSVNGASKETFEENQRGGTWERLCENLQFIKSLRRFPRFNSYALTAFLNIPTRFITLSFIIQKNNYRELPQFIQMAKQLDVDQAMLTTIFHADRTFTDREFALLPVHWPNHPEHQEFLRILSHPALLDPVAYPPTNLELLMPKGRKQRANHEGPPSHDGTWPFIEEGHVDWASWARANGVEGLQGNAAPVALLFQPDTPVQPGTQISFEAFSTHLALEDQQRATILPLLDALKEEMAALLASPAEAGSKSPMEAVEELTRSKPDTQPGEIFQHLIEHAAKVRPLGSGVSYLDRFARIEMQRRAEVYQLLRPRQKRAFLKLPINTLLEVQTAKDPIGNRLMMVMPMHPASPWQILMQQANISPSDAERLRLRVNRHKDKISEIMFQVTATGNQSPGDFLAHLLRESQENAIPRFFQYLSREKCATSGRLYRDEMAELETITKNELCDWLPAGALDAIMLGKYSSLGDLPTGYDPFGKRLTSANAIQHAR